MAIKDDVKITVQVNNQNLVEYENDDADQDDATSITKYIEASGGSKFRIAMQVFKADRSVHDSFSLMTVIDGQQDNSSVLLLPGAIKANTIAYCSGLTTFKNGSGTLHPWKFAEIAEAENDDSGLPKKTLDDLKDIGTISILVRRCTATSKRTFDDSKPTTGRGNMTLREKEIHKGGSLTHSTGLGQPEPFTSSNWNADYVDTLEAPFLRFNFKYRSRRALQSMLLIPRTPTPEPLEDRDVDTLTPEEMRQVIRRQQQRQREDNVATRRLKREIKEEEDGMRRDPVKRAKIKPFSRGEVVDLSD